MQPKILKNIAVLGTVLMCGGNLNAGKYVCWGYGKPDCKSEIEVTLSMGATAHECKMLLLEKFCDSSTKGRKISAWLEPLGRCFNEECP